MEHLNKRILNYKLTRFIGEGGMASVYEGTHERLGTKVAVKILNPILTANKQIRQRFENEAKFMASLNHPNITKVIDYEEQPDVLAIVMELLEGQDLSTLIYTKGALKPEQAIPIFSQILDAFQYAHNKGILHRDIKPSNIFINIDNQIKILDFGIAKIFGTGEDFTSTGTQIGTPVYMSPEQVKADKSIDHRSDIYSLGITLFFALNGKPPYDSTTQSNFEIFNKIVYEPIPDLTLYPVIDKVIKTAVAKDRNQRFKESNDFKNALLSGNFPTNSNTIDDKTLIDNHNDKTLINEPIAKEQTELKPKQKLEQFANKQIEIHQKQGQYIDLQDQKKEKNTVYKRFIIPIGVIFLIVITIFVWQPWNPNTKDLTEVILQDSIRKADGITNIIENTEKIGKKRQGSLLQIQIRDSILISQKQNPIYHEWKSLIKNTDLYNINNAIDFVVSVNNSLSEDAFDRGNRGNVSKLVNSNKLSLKTEELFDFKKVKSIQGDRLGIFIYDYFSCKFVEKNNKIFFQKTTGSQRKSGYLYRKDDSSFVFLGGWSVNEDPLTSYKSDKSQSGILYKISDNKLIMIFIESDKAYEIYDIIK